MKVFTRVLTIAITIIGLRFHAIAEVIASKVSCSGGTNTLNFASAADVELGDVTNTCRVWIYTTVATDVIGKISCSGSPAQDVNIHITGLDYFPASEFDQSQGIVVSTSQWRGFAAGIAAPVLEKINLAVVISGNIVGGITANTILAVRANGSISGGNIEALGSGIDASEDSLRLVRANGISSSISATSGSIEWVDSLAGLTSISVVASNGNIGAVSATGAIEAPGDQPVTISAANIRSVSATRIHANIAATAVDGMIEQVVTTQEDEDSFKGSVTAAVLGSASMPQDATAIDIAGNLEDETIDGEPALFFQNLERRILIGGVAKGKIQIGSAEQPDVVVRRRIQAEGGFTGDIEIFGDLRESIVAGRERVSGSNDGPLINKGIKRLWIKGDLIGMPHAQPRLSTIPVASILARGGTIEELVIEGDIRFNDEVGADSEFPRVYATSIHDFRVGGDATMLLAQGRTVNSVNAPIILTGGLPCIVGSLTVGGLLAGKHIVTWLPPTTAMPAPNQLRVGGGPSREGAAGSYSGLLHVIPSANPSSTVSTGVRAAFRGGSTGLICIEPPLLSTGTPPRPSQFKDQISFGLAGGQESDFCANIAIYQSDSFNSTVRCPENPEPDPPSTYRNSYDGAAIPAAAFAYDKAQTGGGAIGMMPYSLNVDESTPTIEYPQYDNPNYLPQISELQFSSGQVIYGSELWFNGPVYTTLTDPTQSPIKLEYVRNYMGINQSIEIPEEHYRVVVQRGAGTASLPVSRRLVIHATPYFHLGAGLYRVSPATDPSRVSTLLCESPPSWFGPTPPPVEPPVADFQFYFWVGADCDSTLGVDPNWGVYCDQCINCEFADFDQNGGVDGGDVEAFSNAWSAGDLSADANYDGGIDGSDLPVFFKCWERGGC